MNNKLLRGITAFAKDNINEVYQHCYFQLIEERTALIYENPVAGVTLKISVSKDSESPMMFEDMDSGGVTCISTVDETTLVCEDDNIDEDMCREAVGRYLHLMDAFVQFAKAD